ncbi:MAG: GbsR/MarR family transcriptional regulator [Hyphomicrobiaceae bacterium]
MQMFVLHWGEMGTTWGVNRSVAQIHALLFISDDPLTAESIAGFLNLARSNVSNSLKELLGWQLIKRVPVLGDRRDYYTAEADMFEMVRRIAAGRKARELDPTLAVLRECVSMADNDPKMSRGARKRLSDMLTFSEAVDKGFGEILRLPGPTLMALIRLGGKVAKFVRPMGKAVNKR